MKYGIYRISVLFVIKSFGFQFTISDSIECSRDLFVLVVKL